MLTTNQCESFLIVAAKVDTSNFFGPVAERRIVPAGIRPDLK
jgi:hypothetical protein